MCSCALGGFWRRRRAALGARCCLLGARRGARGAVARRGAVSLAPGAVRAARGSARRFWAARRVARSALCARRARGGAASGRRWVRGALWRSFVGALLRWGCFRGRYARELASPTLSAVVAVRGVAGGRGPGYVSHLQQGRCKRVRAPRRTLLRPPLGAPEAAGSAAGSYAVSLRPVAGVLWLRPTLNLRERRRCRAPRRPRPSRTSTDALDRTVVRRVRRRSMPNDGPGWSLDDESFVDRRRRARPTSARGARPLHQSRRRRRPAGRLERHRVPEGGRSATCGSARDARVTDASSEAARRLARRFGNGRA